MTLHIYNEDKDQLTNRKKRGKGDKHPKLKQYKITNKLVSEWFNYSSDKSFNNSSLKQEMLNGVLAIIRHIEAL